MWAPVTRSSPDALQTIGAPGTMARQESEPDLRPVLFSAVLPGSGQLKQGKRRGWAYLAVEAVGWWAYANRRGAGNDARDRYRDFAWENARLQGGARVEGGFEYYEAMSNWQRSGSFDADTGAGGVQPEMDATTYNGTIWARAQRLFLPGGATVPDSDPSYRAALEYYGDRAFGTALLWDWTGTGDAQVRFGELIEESDDRFREATNVLGIVIANHVLSAVDAYLAGRGTRSRIDVRVHRPAPSAPMRWRAAVRVPVR